MLKVRDIWFLLSLHLLVQTVLVASTRSGVHAQVVSDIHDVRPGAKAPDDSGLQFRSGGHILGFMPDRIYVVGIGYALIGEFVGARKVAPVKRALKAAGRFAAAPRFQVVYPEPWKGVVVTYEAAKGGLPNSVFKVSPGSDATCIKFRYNVDVEIRKDGALRFSHPEAQVFLTLAAPVAWQEIGGAKRPVEVSFKAYGDRIIGFNVGEYNGNYPLIIDPAYQWNSFCLADLYPSLSFNAACPR